MKPFAKFVASQVLAVSVLLSGNAPVLACGPYSIDPVFGSTKHGEYPLDDYSGGKLGIIPNSYGRISLFVFYRYLNRMPLNKEERDEVARAIRHRIGIPEGQESTPDTGQLKPTLSPAEKWQKARAAILSDKREIDTEKQNEEYYYYRPNCLAGAFETAIDTLNKRSRKYPAPLVKEWVRGQDAVFSNCPASGDVPSELGSNAPEWLRRDRAYQIAAALFYRDALFESRQAFERIAQDEGSEWSRIAKYLIARTYIREASFLEPKDDSPEEAAKFLERKQELLMMAAAGLNDVIRDPGSPSLHNSAKLLIGLVKYRLDPADRTKQLAETLGNPAANSTIFHDLTDYILLLDRIEKEAEKRNNESKLADDENDPDYWYYRVRLRDVPQANRNEDLTDWLFTYQASDGFAHAFDRWKATDRPHWLAAAISKATPEYDNTEELITAAEASPPDSVAFHTLYYHAIRLHLEKGNETKARQLIEIVFNNGFKNVPIATKNSFSAQRLRLSRDLSEFLTFAKRTPTAFIGSYDGNEAGENPDDLQEMKVWKNREMFGEDAAVILNTSLPLGVWLEAAGSNEIPDHLKDFVASAGWTRAVLLKNKSMERAFARLVSKYSKDFSPRFRTYATARGAADKEAAALIVMARYAVLEPFVPSLWGRKDSLPTTIDSNRGNWWCLENHAESPSLKPAFLTEAQLADGENEYLSLKTLGEGSTALASRSVEFAKQYPRHRLTPEILHLAVRATRYGCRDERTGGVSKAAFDLLHSGYPGSYWTRKTPFWYR